MSEQTMKILKMLEDGKITAAEATELLAKVEELEEEESEPEPRPHPQHKAHFRMPDIGNIPMPPIPQIPDINKIVNDALRDAFSGIASGDEDGPTVGPMTYKGARFAAARMEHTDLTDAKLDSDTRFEGADLRFASFADADLRGANLQGANLSYSDFSDTKFNSANMQGAQLHHGSYVDTDFTNANLQGADLSMSDFSDASFKDVNQPGLVLRGMTLVGVKYEGTPEDAEPQTVIARVDAAVDVEQPPTPPAPPEPHRYSEESDLGDSSVI